MPAWKIKMKSTFNTYTLLFIINHIAFVAIGSFVMWENHFLTPFDEWLLMIRAIYIFSMLLSFVVMFFYRAANKSYMAAKTLNH